MKIQYLPSLVLVGVSLLLLVSSPIHAQVPPVTPEASDEPLACAWAAGTGVPADGASDDLKEAASRSATTAGPVGKRIDVAVGATADQTPVVAHCASDQYLVVYERNDAIYGQRLESDGDLLGSAFLISTGARIATMADVACDWYYNRFIVVWEYDYNGDFTDWDVRARGVWGDHQSSGSQLYGGELIVSQDGGGVDEVRPAIACNSNEHTCLVVFEYTGTGIVDIYAQRVSVGASNISNEGSRFIVGGFSVEEYHADVTWGGYDDDYLVVWQYLHDTPSDHFRILTAYVWDTNQVGSQIETGATYLINPGTYDHHQLWPAAAYNRYTRQYLVVFGYDFYGDQSDYDIKALRLTPGGGSVGSVFATAWSNKNEEDVAVAFSGGTQSISGGMGANQFLVTYAIYSPPSSIFGQAVKGTYATSGDQLEGDPAQIGLDAVGLGSDVTGSVNNGRYLAVWQGGGSTAPDILGQFVGPYLVHLPLILRHSP